MSDTELDEVDESEDETGFSGPALHALRKDQGWSQARLAELMEVTQTTVSEWERSRSIPSRKRLAKLSQLLRRPSWSDDYGTHRDAILVASPPGHPAGPYPYAPHPAAFTEFLAKCGALIDHSADAALLTRMAYERFGQGEVPTAETYHHLLYAYRSLKGTP